MNELQRLRDELRKREPLQGNSCIVTAFLTLESYYTDYCYRLAMGVRKSLSEAPYSFCFKEEGEIPDPAEFQAQYLHGSDWNYGPKGESAQVLTDVMFNYLVEFEALTDPRIKRLSCLKVLMKRPWAWYRLNFFPSRLEKMVERNPFQRTEDNEKLTFTYRCDGALSKVVVSSLWGTAIYRGEPRHQQDYVVGPWELYIRESYSRIGGPLDQLPFTLLGEDNLLGVPLVWRENYDSLVESIRRICFRLNSDPPLSLPMLS